MSYGKEFMEEGLIDEVFYLVDTEVFYLDVCQKLQNLKEEKELRKRNKHFDGVWTTKDGQKIPFSKMTDSHLNNAIHYLQSRIEE